MNALSSNQALCHYFSVVSDIIMFKQNMYLQVYWCNSAAMRLMMLPMDCPGKTLAELGFSMVDRAPFSDSPENKWFTVHYRFISMNKTEIYLKGFEIEEENEKLVIMERYGIADVHVVKSLADDNLQLAALSRDLAKKNQQLSRVNERVSKLVVTDSLTELLNRRAFMRRLSETMVNESLISRTFGLVMIDLDSFKAINDTYGHLAGDEILVLVAKVLHKCIRKGDYAARIGGEEFSVVINANSVDTCLVICERIRSGIEAITCQNKTQITACLGLTMFRVGDSENALTKRADSALFYAKSIGYNRVIIEL